MLIVGFKALRGLFLMRRMLGDDQTDAASGN
jgi:hypothetical protein